jgi:hypothetical protein
MGLSFSFWDDLYFFLPNVFIEQLRNQQLLYYRHVNGIERNVCFPSFIKGTEFRITLCLYRKKDRFEHYKTVFQINIPPHHEASTIWQYMICTVK